jgi:PAS domain S-box-containing protein
MKKSPTPNAIRAVVKKIDRQQWLLWASAVIVTLLLTVGIVSFVIPALIQAGGDFESLHLALSVRGLVGLVLLFDIYAIYQQLQIHRIRKELGQREELFRLISENAADMIAVVDADGRRLYNSPAYERILGYTAEELNATSPFEQIHPEDVQKVQEAASEARNGGVARSIEYRMRHKNGSWRVLESTASTVRNDNGDVDKLVIVNRDISERKHLEEQFRQAQKMEAVGRLSGGIAHDFNNLLGIIIGYAEALQEQLQPGDALRASADEIFSAGTRAASLTQQLLAFSRQQVLDPTVLDLNAVVSNMNTLLRRVIGEDIELTTALDWDLGRVKADHSQLDQVILNLAVNARDAMPKGGKLMIKTETVVLDEEFERQHPYPVKRGRYVCLTVTDTGVGMNAETKAKAFEPFFTTKERGKGTGLGLSTVYGVVKQSGGYIDVESAPCEGTSFQIYLPQTEEGVTTEKLQAESTPPKALQTILLAEDEDSLRALTRNTLQGRGYTVLEAKNGVEALKIGRKYVGGIDLLLTDVVMPEMGGHELAQQLVRERPGIKVVYISGYTGQLPGMKTFFLMKPFTRDALTQKIREALETSIAAEFSGSVPIPVEK